MPKETIYLTDIELQILRVFMEKKVLDSKTIASALEILLEKLGK